MTHAQPEAADRCSSRHLLSKGALVMANTRLRTRATAERALATDTATLSAEYGLARVPVGSCGHTASTPTLSSPTPIAPAPPQTLDRSNPWRATASTARQLTGRERP